MKKIIYSLFLCLLVTVSLPLFAVEFQRNVDFVDASIVGDYNYMIREMRQGMKIDTPRGNFNYSTALMKAVQRQDMKMINFCLRYGASVNRRDPVGSTPLMMAAASGNQAVVNLLLRRRAGINLVNHQKQGALGEAALNNDLAMVSLLLRKGARADKNLALIFAAKASNEKMVKLLLRYGASVYYEHHEWGTPLYMAVSTGNINTVKALLDKSRSLVNRSFLARTGGLTPLGRAAQMGDLTMMKYLISRGASIHYKNSEGNSLLFTARPRAALFLLSKGLSPRIKSKYGETLLQRYCINRGFADPRVVRELLKRGASARGANKHGVTFLMGAAGGGKLDIVKLLVKNGASINKKDSRGNSAVAYAVRGGHFDVEKYLLSRGGVKTNARFLGRKYPYKAYDADTANMVQAVFENNTSVIEQLTAAGIRLTAYDHRNRNALDEAVSVHNVRIVKWLLEKGRGWNRKSLNAAYIYFAARDLGMVKDFLARGADLHANKGAALTAAVVSRKSDITAFLLEKGIMNKDTREILSKSLVRNAGSGKYFIIESLIKHGADCKSVYGAEALIFVSQHRGSYLPKKIIALLLSKGADRNYKNKIGRTALDSAGVIKNTKLITWMKSRGFKSGKEIKGKSEAQKQYASQLQINNLIRAVFTYKSIGRVRAIVRSGVDINSRNKSGWTVLHAAAGSRQWRIVPGLLDLGVDRKIKSKLGYTARQLAVKRNNSLFVKALDGYKPASVINKDKDAEKKDYAYKKDFSSEKRNFIRPRPVPPGKKDYQGGSQVLPQNIKGLKLYGNPSCGRCRGFRRKLDKEGIKYTFIDLNQNYGAKKYMWARMRQQGFRDSRVSYPILELNGKMLWPDRKKHFTVRGVFWVEKYFQDYLKLKK